MTGPTWLLAVGLVVWLIAQALPATHGGYPVVLVVTLVGWGFAILGALLSVSLGSGILGLVGWTANLWLLGALVARRRGKLSRALGLSWVALLCALAEVVFLYLLSGGTHCCDLNALDANAYGVQIIEPTWDSVGLGTWVWVASFALVYLLGLKQPAGDDRPTGRRGARFEVPCLLTPAPFDTPAGRSDTSGTNGRAESPVSASPGPAAHVQLRSARCA